MKKLILVILVIMLVACDTIVYDSKGKVLKKEFIPAHSTTDIDMYIDFEGHPQTCVVTKSVPDTWIITAEIYYTITDRKTKRQSRESTTRSVHVSETQFDKCHVGATFYYNGGTCLLENN